MIPATLRFGVTSDLVLQWRRIIGNQSPSSFFDEGLDAQTRAWQADHGLGVDGVVGPASWAEGLELAIVRGIDVSAVQGDLTDRDWAAIRAAGIEFAIMRAVVGNEGRDARFVANVTRARAAGVIPGAYCFAFPLPHLSPEDQAEHFVSLLDGFGSSVGDMPLALDIEWPPHWERDKTDPSKLIDLWAKWGCSAEQIRGWLLRCLERGERLTGHRWIAYTYRDFWDHQIDGAKLPALMDRPLWLADYSAFGRVPTVAEAHSTRPLTGGWEPLIVQHDGNGGLRLPDGRDADFNVFLGSRADLEVLCGAPREFDPTVAEVARAARDVTRSSTAAILTDEMIATYRRERVDVAV